MSEKWQIEDARAHDGEWVWIKTDDESQPSIGPLFESLAERIVTAVNAQSDGRVAALEQALAALVRFCEVHEREAVIMQVPSWYVATVPNPIREARAALAGQGRAAGEPTAYEMHPELDWSAKCTCPTGWLHDNNGWHRGPNACPRYDLDVVRRQHIPAASQPGGPEHG